MAATKSEIEQLNKELEAAKEEYEKCQRELEYAEYLHGKAEERYYKLRRKAYVLNNFTTK